MPALCASGDLMSSLILQRCQSVTVDSGKFSAHHNVIIAATHNAQQSEETWISFARVWLPLCKATKANPGLIFMNGHTTHVTSTFIAECARHSLYVTVEPSHASMILQVADLGVDRFPKTQYAKEYTAAMCIAASSVRGFDDTERIGCAVRTLQALRERKDIIIRCFEKAGLTSGFVDVTSRFKVSTFSAGSSSRDTRLPSVTQFYIDAVLSIRNLCQKIGSPLTVPETVINQRLRSLHHYVDVDNGFRQFYFSLGRLTEGEAEEEAQLLATTRDNTSVEHVSESNQQPANGEDGEDVVVVS